MRAMRIVAKIFHSFSVEPKKNIRFISYHLIFITFQQENDNLNSFKSNIIFNFSLLFPHFCFFNSVKTTACENII